MAPQRKSTRTTITDEGPNKGECDVCGMHFARDLRRHKRIHLDQPLMKCPYEYCDKRFNQTQNLNTHVYKWHIGSRPHACTYEWVDEFGVASRCAARFDDRAALTRHQKTQHGHQPHAKTQTAEARVRSRDRQEKVRQYYEVKAPQKAVERMTGRWMDEPDVVGPWTQPSADGVHGSAAARSGSSSSSARASPSSASDGSSRTSHTRTRNNSPSSACVPLHISGSSSWSAVSSTMVSGSSSRRSLESSSSSTSSHRSSNAVSGIFRQPMSRNSSFGGNDPFSSAPYRISPADTPIMSAGSTSRRPQFPPAYPDIVHMDPLMCNQSPSQFFDMPQYADLYATPSAMGWGLQQDPTLAMFPDPLLAPHTGFSTNMGMGVPDMLSFNMPPRVPYAAHASSPSEGWGTPGGYSRESSPTGSLSSSVGSSPPIVRRGEAQDAYAYRYMRQ